MPTTTSLREMANFIESQGNLTTRDESAIKTYRECADEIDALRTKAASNPEAANVAIEAARTIGLGIPLAFLIQWFLLPFIIDKFVFLACLGVFAYRFARQHRRYGGSNIL